MNPFKYRVKTPELLKASFRVCLQIAFFFLATCVTARNCKHLWCPKEK